MCLVVAAAHLGVWLAVCHSQRSTVWSAELPALEVALLDEEPEQAVVAPPDLPRAVLRDIRIDLQPIVVPTAPPAHTAITVPPSPTSAETERVADEPPLISEVAYVRAPAPRYPPASRRERERGLVVLRVLVDDVGRAVEVVVHRSSGYPRLDAAACSAVADALFRPYVEDGRARPALVMIPIEFELNPRSHRRG